MTTKEPLDIAIIGGGVIGVMMALGLLDRGFKVSVYERAPTWHELSAGFSFTALARECMQQLSPTILEVLGQVADNSKSTCSTSYWDGYHPQTKATGNDPAVSHEFQVPGNDLAFWACVRSQFLLGMAKHLPADMVHFSKKFVSYEETAEKVTVHFSDGTAVSADLVIGCDGIHSSVRGALLGPGYPPSFTQTVAYRTMVPIEHGVAALGLEKSRIGCMHCGPKASMMTYPVHNGKLLNIAVFAFEPTAFVDSDTVMTAPASRARLLDHVLADWSPHVRELAALFPEEGLTKWGIFDMDGHPVPTYTRGRVCLAGDAAHASTPFQGVGACMGVEDALVLCEALTLVTDNASLHRALQAYSDARLPRGHWVVHSSREMGIMCQWRSEKTGRSPERSQRKHERAERKIWDYDMDGVLESVRAQVVKV